MRNSLFIPWRFDHYSERHKWVVIKGGVIANEVKQSHEIAASLRSSQ
jgi:hypothetical protein